MTLDPRASKKATELGVLLYGDDPMPRLAEVAHEVEVLGYDYLWIGDEKFNHDPFVSLAVMAHATERMMIGPCVTEPYARHPALIAMAMGSLDELCHGRLVLGLGPGGPGFSAMGTPRPHPATAVTEAVKIIRGLLAGESVDFSGRVLSFKGRLLFAAHPLPIFVAARGAQVLAAAGSIADAVIMGPFASPSGIAYASGVVGRGARDSSRTVPPRLIGRVDVCIGSNLREAEEAVRPYVAMSLWNSYPNWGYITGSGVELSDRIRELVATTPYMDSRVASALPAEMISTFAVCGDEAEVETRLRELSRLVDQLIIHPIRTASYTKMEVLKAVAGMRQSMPAGSPAGN
jgi:5,10-methylenetetrahydromethanopterin reductase